MDVLDEIRFLAQISADAERTLLCEPQLAPVVQAAVDQEGASHLFAVRASEHCPPGRILVLDEQAMGASWRQTVQRAVQDLRVYGRGGDEPPSEPRQ